MPIASPVTSGTLSPGVLNTPININGTALTTLGYYVLRVDLGAMATGDQISITGTDSVLSGGTIRSIFTYTPATGAQFPAIYTSDPIAILWSGQFTFNQIAGTLRTF